MNAARAPLLTPAVRSTVRLTLAFAAAVLGWYAVTVHGGPGLPRDGSGLVVGRDFLNTWMYGRAAHLPDPARWYRADRYEDAVAALLGSDYPGQNWSYPPPMLLLAAPFGTLGYGLALAVWTALGVAAFAATLRARRAPIPVVAALVACPAAVLCLVSGQSSLLSAAAFLLIFTQLERRPVLAGILIGCLSLKPQLGLLFPVMLAAAGRWRTFGAAAATVAALGAASLAAFGTEPWLAYWRDGLPTQNLVLADPGGIATPFFPTVFMNLRGIGVPYGAAMAIQLAATAGAATLVWRRWRRAPAPEALEGLAIFSAASIAATPYLLVYDTLPLSMASVLLMAEGRLDSRGVVLAKLAVWLPLAQMALGLVHLPGAALVAPAVALAFAGRSRPRRRPAERRSRPEVRAPTRAPRPPPPALHAAEVAPICGVEAPPEAPDLKDEVSGDGDRG